MRHDPTARPATDDAGRRASPRAVLVAALLSLTALLASPAAAVRAESPTEVVCDTRSVAVGTPLVPRQFSGTYCRPADGSATSAIVMVPGGTYNRVYWDFPFQPARYSFARAAARSGYAAFAIDRLGTGESSRPPSVTVTTSVQANALHRLIGRLRGEGLGGAGFEQVLVAGHSLGSAVAVIEAGTHRDVDGVIVTGLTHRANPVGASTLAASLYPAALDPAFGGLGLDLGYVTTRPGTRQAAFHDPGQVDPAVIAADEATKDVFSLTELPELAVLSLLLDLHAGSITAPVLIAVGAEDRSFCGPPLATDCGTSAALLAEERPEYSGAPCVDALVMPAVGHDLNLHPSAPALQADVLAWTDAVVSGHCPEG